MGTLPIRMSSCYELVTRVVEERDWAAISEYKAFRELTVPAA
jgi:hypothetical protein